MPLRHSWWLEEWSRDELRIAESVQVVRIAMPLIDDPTLIITHHLLASALIEQVQVMLGTFDRFDAQIAAVASTLPDYALFHAMPSGVTRLTKKAANSKPVATNNIPAAKEGPMELGEVAENCG